MLPETGHLLRIFIGEADKHDGQPQPEHREAAKCVE
jgi:hypothetical protein